MIAVPAQANTRDGLVGWWKLDETSGKALDSSWKGGDGTLTSITYVKNCPRGGCYHFSGAGSVSLTAGGSSATTANATITGWIKPTAALFSYEAIFLTRDNLLQGLLLSGSAGNPLTYDWEGGADEYNAATGLTVPLNLWSFFAVVITPTKATVYLNKSSWSNTKTHNAKTINLNWYIGLDVTWGRWWVGDIDDVRLYNRSLTDQEIQDLYNPGILLRGTGTTLQGTGTKFNY